MGGRPREREREKETVTVFLCRLLGMSWLRRSQDDLLGEKKEGYWEESKKDGDRETSCHGGIPLSSPVLPALS